MNLPVKHRDGRQAPNLGMGVGIALQHPILPASLTKEDAPHARGKAMVAGQAGHQPVQFKSRRGTGMYEGRKRVRWRSAHPWCTGKPSTERWREGQCSCSDNLSGQECLRSGHKFTPRL